MGPRLPFLSAADAERASRSLRKLARHGTGCWALTGGLAFEMHAIRLGMGSGERALNDLDFVAASFGSIPQTLAGDFLFRHIHPHVLPGKNYAAVDRSRFGAADRRLSRASHDHAPSG